MSTETDLTRFIREQELTHEAALRELRSGHKRTHWSWWEIPQIAGLGWSSFSRFYAIRDLAEAREYLENEILRRHLLEICGALLSLDGKDPGRVMGHPDDLKLHSCMTLFQAADPKCEAFTAVLDQYFGGKPDMKTLKILDLKGEPIMSAPIVKVDLHGLHQEEAVKVIDKAIAAADSSTYKIQLIHGYNRGTSLRSMIYDEFRYEKKVKRIIPGDNPGITILVMKEMF